MHKNSKVEMNKLTLFLLVVLLGLALVESEHWTVEKRRERQAAADAMLAADGEEEEARRIAPHRSPLPSTPRSSKKGSSNAEWDGKVSCGPASTHGAKPANEEGSTSADEVARRRRPKQKNKDAILKTKRKSDLSVAESLGVGMEPAFRGPPYNCGPPCNEGCALGYHLDVDGCPDNCACLTEDDVTVRSVVYKYIWCQ